MGTDKRLAYSMRSLYQYLASQRVQKLVKEARAKLQTRDVGVCVGCTEEAHEEISIEEAGEAQLALKQIFNDFVPNYGDEFDMKEMP